MSAASQPGLTLRGRRDDHCSGRSPLRTGHCFTGCRHCFATLATALLQSPAFEQQPQGGHLGGEIPQFILVIILDMVFPVSNGSQKSDSIDVLPVVVHLCQMFAGFMTNHP